MSRFIMVAIIAAVTLLALNAVPAVSGNPTFWPSKIKDSQRHCIADGGTWVNREQSCHINGHVYNPYWPVPRLVPGT